MDAHPSGHQLASRAPVHGRSVRLLPAGEEPALEDADAHPAQASPGVRIGRGARHAKPRRRRLQGPVQLRHVVAGAAADQARPRSHSRRTRGCRGERKRHVFPRGHGGAHRGSRHASVRDEQRAPRCTGAVRVALGALVFARPAHPRSTSFARAQARRSAHRRRPTHASSGRARRHPDLDRPRAEEGGLPADHHRRRRGAVSHQ